MEMSYRNVNAAFAGMVSAVSEGWIKTTRTTSRYGDVLVIEQPVTLEYTHPTEKVLFNPARDCNPFFHLYESLWMLAGRNDVASLNVYSSKMKEFSDDGQTFNGAYGYRWRKRHYFKGGLKYEGTPIDQLKILIQHLRAKPDSRRAVLQMWNVEDDLLKIDGKWVPCPDCKGSLKRNLEDAIFRGAVCPKCGSAGEIQEPGSKDVCCNLDVCFLIREQVCETCQAQGKSQEQCENINRFLDMTVFNRSNDMILGMLGANAVHFAFLHEYMAYATGCRVGKYWQISNNVHVYTNNWKPREWLGDGPTPLDLYRMGSGLKMIGLMDNKTGATPEEWVPAFDNECAEFVTRYGVPGLVELMPYDSEFLDKVAQPMLQAYKWHKEQGYATSRKWLEAIKSEDWRIAAINWLHKRWSKINA